MVERATEEIGGGDLDMVEGEFVTVRQSSVKAVEGGHVELQQVGALSVDGERIEMTQSAAAIVRAEDIRITQGIGMITAGNTTNLGYSFSLIALSRDTTSVNRSAVGFIGAKTVVAENSASLVTIANKVEGQMTTLLDWRSSLALGAVVGGIMGLFSLFRKR
jgi:hypothetical protein